jgi:hypothetical protein
MELPVRAVSTEMKFRKLKHDKKIDGKPPVKKLPPGK